MTNPKGSTNIIGQQNVATFLIFLLDLGGSSKATFIQKVISNYSSIKKIGDVLESEGLVTITNVTEKNSYILYELTEKGLEVAKHLKKAENALKGIYGDDYISASGRGIPAIDEKKE